MQPELPAVELPPASAQDVALEEIARRVGNRNFEHWFQGKTNLEIHDDELTVGVASPFLLNWMQKHFRSAVVAAAQSLLGPSARVRFEVDTAAALRSPTGTAPKAGPPVVAKSADAPPAAAVTVVSRKEPVPAQPPTPVGRRFAELADFVEGDCNRLALTAARQVCESPGSRFNPLFLHGSVGVGKTHLLEGISRRIRRMYPSLQVMFLTAEAFANYFTQALREHTLPAFRQKFRTVDVLLVDDIDFLDSKRVIQEEFLHTFKQLESHGRQIVLTSDRHPRLLSKLSDELVTRFLSGLVCRVEAPDLATRTEIVERKAAKLGAEIAPEALTFVAQRFKGNVRELEGALNCLATYHSMTGKRVGLAAARNVLADLERDCIRIVRITDIEHTVCSFFGVEAKDLRSANRSRTLSQPRMLAMFLARKLTQAAYSEIGQFFGGRNHSTVMSAEKKVRDWLDGNATLQVHAQSWPLDELIESLEQQLRAG